MDAEPGLIYPRAPTWARLAKGSVRRSRMEWQPEGPFRLQFYRNGHSWLAGQPTAAGIDFAAADDACVRIDDWQRAQELADTFSPGLLHRVLDRHAAQCCPVREVVGQTCHRSLLQVECATDPVFGSAVTLRPLDEQPTRQSVLSVETEQIASFLGRQITPQLAQEPGSQFSTRIEGTCTKHRFGQGSLCLRGSVTGLHLRVGHGPARRWFSSWLHRSIFLAAGLAAIRHVTRYCASVGGCRQPDPKRLGWRSGSLTCNPVFHLL